MTMATLVIDGTQPVGIIPWKKAVKAVFRGVAEVVKNYEDDHIYTNEHDIDVYDPDVFGPLGRFFDEELMDNGKVRVTMSRPAVVRFFTPQVQKKRVRFTRQNLYLRDNYECQYVGCETTKMYEQVFGTKSLPSKMLNFEHVIPKDLGGDGGWRNVVTSCIECNNKKKNRTPKQADMILRHPPREPLDVPIVSMRANTPDEWLNWLYWNVSLEM